MKRQAPLARPKTMFKTSRAAWISLGKQTGLRPDQVTAAHTPKAWFWKLKGSVRKATSKVKKRTSKRRNPSKKSPSSSKRSSRTKRSGGSKKMVAKKGGKSGKSRLRNLLIGFGVGAGVSTAAGLLRTPELEAAGPIIDALAGTGVEGQVGTAIPRLIRQVLIRTNGFGNGRSNGLALEGA